MATKDETVAEISDYYLVVRFLASLQCAACGGSGNRSVTKKCTMCEGTGFRDGAVHYLIDARQVKKGKRR